MQLYFQHLHCFNPLENVDFGEKFQTFFHKSLTSISNEKLFFNSSEANASENLDGMFQWYYMARYCYQ